jgi:hypothetical protein
MANHFSEFDAFNVPPEFKPLGAWAYFLLTVLFSIPIIGLIFLIIFSFSDANINRRNYARSYFCMMVVMIVLVVAGVATGVISDFTAQTVEAINAGQWPGYLSFLPWVS